MEKTPKDITKTWKPTPLTIDVHSIDTTEEKMHCWHGVAICCFHGKGDSILLLSHLVTRFPLLASPSNSSWSSCWETYAFSQSPSLLCAVLLHGAEGRVLADWSTRSLPHELEMVRLPPYPDHSRKCEQWLKKPMAFYFALLWQTEEFQGETPP